MDYRWSKNNEFCKKNLISLNVSSKDPLTGINGKFPIMSTIFEEFEYIGWFSYNHTNDYCFIEGPNTIINCLQFWSHGGLTEDIKINIEEVLK